MTAVSAKSLSKNYDKTTALENVDLRVERGEIFGIIGPDGAGKTTLFRILTSLLLPDSGTAYVGGLNVVKDYKAIRTIIGYMPGQFSLYQDMTVEENLSFFATLFNTRTNENYHLIRDIYTQIEPFKKRRAGALSGGMKQKLALCCALIHKPEILFLDEPTTGVDTISRKELWQMLFKLKQQGITILVSTPYMDEASLCDRIALMRNGSVMEINTPTQIKEHYDDVLWAVKGNNMPRLLNDLRRNPQVKTAFAFGNVHHITVESSLSINELREYLTSNGNTQIEITTIKPDIEDCYMKAAAQ
ncbi:MAG: ABC transporter ATP-binding protein [Dysgonamonadaceae bacterium]|jgi:ABC-type multidrug transport system ATPase subunit|nr:ABC transporter ATP-binding protein [Dysgonamonadaceae bacterium]